MKLKKNYYEMSCNDKSGNVIIVGRKSLPGSFIFVRKNNINYFKDNVWFYIRVYTMNCIESNIRNHHETDVKKVREPFD